MKEAANSISGILETFGKNRSPESPGSVRNSGGTIYTGHFPKCRVMLSVIPFK
jgi:hypothetical protein